MFTTLTDYAKSNRLPAPRRAQFQQIQDQNTCGDLSSHAAKADRAARAAMAAQAASVNEANNDEAQLDSEAVYAMAPDATQRMVVAAACGQGPARRLAVRPARRADPDTGLLVCYIQDGTDAQPGPYQTAPNAGTSLACPLIAALVADAQQGQPAPFGFLNPLLYRLSGTKALHDILPPSPATPQQNRDGYLPAAGAFSPGLDVFGSPEPGQTLAKGYDSTTGLGAPDGTAFIDGLRKASR